MLGWPLHPSPRLILKDFKDLVLLRHLGLGRGSEIITPKWEQVLDVPFASRHWKCFLLTCAFSASPPHAACPVSWRYWSLPRPVGRRRTLGDLYAISWRQGALPRVEHLGLLAVWGKHKTTLSLSERKIRKGIFLCSKVNKNVYVLLHLVLLQPAPLRVKHLLVCSVFCGALQAPGVGPAKRINSDAGVEV